MSVVTRVSEPDAKQGIFRDWVTLLLKPTHLFSVPSKLGNLKLLWGAGTLVAVAVAEAAGAATARLSAMMRATSMVVISRGGAAMASEMEGRRRLLDNGGCLVLALVRDETVVPATDGVKEVPPVPWSRESTWTMGGMGCVGADNHPA